MGIRVSFFTTLRKTINKGTEEIEAEGDIAVKELLNRLSERYGPDFTDYVYDEEGKLHTHFQLLVNGRNIAHLQGLHTLLKSGDAVAFVPPMGGG